jgi:hypothetical protein
MSRIPTHRVEDAPAASRPLLQEIIQSTPTGRPANMHAQMAHSPAVLTAYTSLRAVLAEHTSFDPKASVCSCFALKADTAVAPMGAWRSDPFTTGAVLCMAFTMFGRAAS